MADKIADELRAALAGATPGPYEGRDARGLDAPATCIDYAVVSLSAGHEVSRVWTEVDARFGELCSPDRITALLDALDAKDKRIAELEAALDDALDTILEHILADSSPVTKEDQPAIEAFDRAVEEGRARLSSSLLNKEDRNG